MSVERASHRSRIVVVTCIVYFLADPSSIARYKLGEVLSDTVGGHGFLRARFHLDEPRSLRLTLAVPRGAVAGFYARRDEPPSFARYEVFHVVDANKVVPASATAAGHTSATSSRRHRRTSADHDVTVRAILLPPGVWGCDNYRKLLKSTENYRNVPKTTENYQKLTLTLTNSKPKTPNPKSYKTG